jgi:hypothetical protein
MQSIFDLKTDVSELSQANEGTSRMEYEQHAPTRDVTGSNFSNGQMHFRFETSGQKWWIPSRSYIRTRFRLRKGDNTANVDLADAVAPNMALMSNLFQNAEMRINDKVVSRVADYMAQVDALETRLTKSKSWLDSVGEATNWWQPSQALRLAEASSDGTIVRNTTAIVPPETAAIDTAIGYDAQHSVAYVAQTGLVTFAQGGAGGAPPNTNVNFAVGDFLVLTTLPGNEDGALNVRLEVLAVNANLTMTVRADIGVDIAAENGIRFSRVRPNPIVAPPSRRVGEFELCWTPPLSLFKVGHGLPSGRYELVLTPQTEQQYQKRGIESILGQADKNPTLTGGANQDFRLEVVNMYLYCATVEGPRADDITYLLDLEQTRCQADKIDNRSFAQKNFDVSPSTYALTVAYQDQRAGVHSSISSSKFRSYDPAANPTDPQELTLNRMFVQYAGQQLPQPDAEPDFVAGKDYTIQRYNETNLYSGAYYDTGGAESIEEYHERGAYYYFSFPRDGTDRSTRVQVHSQFGNAVNDAAVANTRVLLFDHSKQVARVRVQDGRVTDVQLEDA